MGLKIGHIKGLNGFRVARLETWRSSFVCIISSFSKLKSCTLVLRLWGISVIFWEYRLIFMKPMWSWMFNNYLSIFDYLESTSLIRLDEEKINKRYTVKIFTLCSVAPKFQEWSQEFVGLGARFGIERYRRWGRGVRAEAVQFLKRWFRIVYGVQNLSLRLISKWWVEQ